MSSEILSSLPDEATPGLPQSQASSPLHSPVNWHPLGFKSPIWCLMSAFVTTLGVFNLDCFLWCLCLLSSLFYLLARSLSLAALAWGVSQTFQPQLPPLRLAGSRVTGPHSLPADPRGACMSQAFCLANSNVLSKTEVGVTESRRQICCFRKGCVFTEHRVGLPSQGPCSIQTCPHPDSPSRGDFDFG